ncbi:MAG TPA: carboxypeptidase regulatory-like domain-containing protein [Terriglobia bacterium]|nr:carboxypeptidase regulatory-like domain-containing protein [Terriglobia bacterium]
MRNKCGVVMGGWAALAAISLICTISIFPGRAAAQVASAGINGTVTDSSGAVVPGASVTLTNVNTSARRVTVSNNVGNYTLVDILPGTYTLEARKRGFETQQQAAFTLSVNQTVTYNFTLPVGAATQTVTVSASAAKLQTASAELGSVVSPREVNSLPLNGRNFTELLALTPGVSTVNTSQNGGGFDTNPIGTYSFPSVGGQTNRSNMFLLDGLNDLEVFNSTYTVSPIVDDIEEFKVDSHNDQAAFGGVLGGVINVVTKSGTNQLHGAGWEFLRNASLDARNPFLPNVTPYAWNEFGGDVGGPVLIPHLYHGQNKTFFFGSYEGVRIHTANSSLYLIPTPAELNGDFSGLVNSSGQAVQLYNPFTTQPDPSNPNLLLRQPFLNNQIPVTDMDPHTLALAEAIYPTPINTGVAGTNAENTAPKIQDSNEYNLRIDQNLGTKDSFWWRFSHVAPPGYSTGNYLDEQSSALYHAYQMGVNWTHTFGPTTVMDIEFGRNYGYEVNSTLFSSAESTKLNGIANYSNTFDCGFSGGPRTCYVPGVGISGYDASWGETYTATSLADLYEWKGDLTKILGKHNLSMGVDITKNSFISPLDNSSVSYNSFQTSNLETSTGGDGLASFLLGVPDSAGERNVLEAEHGGWEDGFYFQDQWRPSRKLTVNIGVRYDLPILPIYGSSKGASDPNNLVGDLDLNNGTYIMEYNTPFCSTSGKPPCVPGSALPANVVIAPSNGRIVHSTEDNISPRFGFAYQLSKNNVIRGSFVRMFDDWAAVEQMAQNYEGSWPSTGQLLANNLNQGLPNITAEDPFSGGAAFPAATPFQQVQWFMDPLIQNPYSWQWNFGIQHAFGQNTVMTVNYAGATDLRLDEGIYSNVAVTPGPGDAAVVASRQPYPYITPTYYDRSVGKGYYHAFEFSLDRKAGKGLSYLISYTYSKMIDQGSDGWFGVESTSIQDPYDLKMDKSVAGFDLTHNFSGSFVYQLPFGKGQRFQTGSRAVDWLIGPWQLNGIATVSSGPPYTLGAPSGIPNTGNVSERPDYTGQPVGVSTPTPALWFNPLAFAAPAPYTFGNVGRNTMRADWPHNLDFSIFRQFPITESKTLELRAEFYNIGNWVVWGTPDTSVTDTTFGQITNTANSSREIQLALKLYF